MFRRLPRVLARIRRLARERRVRFTHKALRELAELRMGLDPDDACDVLANLTSKDAVGRLVSERTGERVYAFRPQGGGARVYVKPVLRRECVLISFHEEEDHEQEEDP